MHWFPLTIVLSLGAVVFLWLGEAGESFVDRSDELSIED